MSVGKGAHEFILELDSLEKGAKVFIEKWPDFGSSSSLKAVREIKAKAFVNSKVIL